MINVYRSPVGGECTMNRKKAGNVNDFMVQKSIFKI